MIYSMTCTDANIVRNVVRMSFMTKLVFSSNFHKIVVKKIVRFSLIRTMSFEVSYEHRSVTVNDSIGVYLFFLQNIGAVVYYYGIYI